MDCPSEENLIRMKLESIDSIINQEYDLTNRTLTVFHDNDIEQIDLAIAALDFGSKLLENKEASFTGKKDEDKKQRKTLWIVLLINFGFFIIEMTTGLISKSMGLVADSLDMCLRTLWYMA